MTLLSVLDLAPVPQGFTPGDALRKELQDLVKRELSPYKYPRRVEFLDALPRTPTGKVQRSALRKREA